MWRIFEIETIEVDSSTPQKISQSISQFEALVKSNKNGAFLAEQFVKFDAELKRLLSRKPVDEKDSAKRKAH